LLETLHSDKIEEGIELAIYNARGVTWRNPTDGGAQERQLVEQYRSQADTLRSRSPRTAAMLRRLAQRYEEGARWHDHEAELRQNGW
jgi:hypothetical protein